jgi:hypothetical protein
LFFLGCQATEIKKAPSESDIVANYPKMVVGDSWTYRDSSKKFGIDIYTATIVYVEKDGSYTIKVTGKKGGFTRVYNFDAEHRQINPPVGRRLLEFPLFIGKQWSAKFEGRSVSGERYEYKDTYEVKGYETVTTEAGSVEAFRIRRTNSNLDTFNDYPTVYWYSPVFKLIVKSDCFGRKIGRNLISYTLVRAHQITTEITYVEIKKPDKLSYRGETVHDVSPGDVLKVISTNTCRGGSGECWKVQNVKTGETGFVKAKRMKAWHRVYKEENK